MSKGFKRAVALVLAAAIAFAGSATYRQPDIEPLLPEYQPQPNELRIIYTALPGFQQLEEQLEYQLDDEIGDEDVEYEYPEDEPAEEEEAPPPPAPPAPPPPAAQPAQPAQAPVAPQTEEQPSLLSETERVDAAAFEAEVIRVINIERSMAGLPPLHMNTRLRQAARIRARELPVLFSHNRPGGRAWHTVLTDVGVRPYGSGENIASGHITPTSVVIAWMNSPSHRRNILASNFTQIGVGVYQDANGMVHWVQLFTV